MKRVFIWEMEGKRQKASDRKSWEGADEEAEKNQKNK